MPAKRSGGVVRTAAGAVVGVVAKKAVDAMADPENMQKAAEYIGRQHLGEKVREAAGRINLPKRFDPMRTVNEQLASVDQLIETHADELSDDAPLEEWRKEVSKLRNAVELFGKDTGKSRKTKLKWLRERSQKLYDAAFEAALK